MRMCFAESQAGVPLADEPILGKSMRSGASSVYFVFGGESSWALSEGPSWLAPSVG